MGVSTKKVGLCQQQHWDTWLCDGGLGPVAGRHARRTSVQIVIAVVVVVEVVREVEILVGLKGEGVGRPALARGEPHKRDALVDERFGQRELLARGTETTVLATRWRRRRRTAGGRGAPARHSGEDVLRLRRRRWCCCCCEWRCCCYCCCGKTVSTVPAATTSASASCVSRRQSQCRGRCRQKSARRRCTARTRQRRAGVHEARTTWRASRRAGRRRERLARARRRTRRRGWRQLLLRFFRRERGRWRGWVCDTARVLLLVGRRERPKSEVVGRGGRHAGPAQLAQVALGQGPRERVGPRTLGQCLQ